MINHFVKEWNEVGVVTRAAGPPDGMFPKTMFVEMGMNVEPPKKKLLKALGAEPGAVGEADEPEVLPNPRDFR